MPRSSKLNIRNLASGRTTRCCSVSALPYTVCLHRGIAEAVAANVGVPVKAVTREEAYQIGIWPSWVVPLISTNNQCGSAKAQRELHWGAIVENSKNLDMLEDIARGSYK